MSVISPQQKEGSSKGERERERKKGEKKKGARIEKQTR
jgi:hypothetical protein